MGIKISELSRKSNIPASTIRYYVKMGLLPAPEKKNKSMSYYDESCVETLQIIKRLQENKYFPLAIIQNILKRMRNGVRLEDAVAIEQVIFGTQTEPLVDREQYRELTGLSDEDLSVAEKMGLLMPYTWEGGKNHYDHDDIRFGVEVIKELSLLGIDIRKFDFYLDLGRQIADQEVRFRRQVVDGLTKQENSHLTKELAKRVELIRTYVLKRLFQRRVQASFQKDVSNTEKPNHSRKQQ